MYLAISNYNHLRKLRRFFPIHPLAGPMGTHGCWSGLDCLRAGGTGSPGKRRSPGWCAQRARGADLTAASAWSGWAHQTLLLRWKWSGDALGLVWVFFGLVFVKFLVASIEKHPNSKTPERYYMIWAMKCLFNPLKSFINHAFSTIHRCETPCEAAPKVVEEGTVGTSEQGPETPVGEGRAAGCCWWM